jgi:histidine kinase
MIAIPFLLFLLIEVIAGYVLFYVLGRGHEEAAMELFTTIRVTGLLLAITVSNGLITYLVSRSILKPVRMLMQAAKEITEGNLDFSLAKTGKDEIGELAVMFEEMRNRLLEAKQLQMSYEENRKELIASISHDLRTPMTSIQGYSRGIIDGVAQSPEKVQHYAKIIHLHANAMEKRINELFLYSKLELKRVPMVLEAVDLRAFMADYAEELSYTLEQEGGRVIYTHNTEETYIVQADRDQLRRVVENIIQNSLKYMEKEVKTIEMRLISEGHQVKVEIEDNGKGITSDALPFIFDSFYREDAARNSSTGGSGLGMSIAKQIIEAQGGHMGAASEVGVGTTVFFCLNKWDGGAAQNAEGTDY